MTTYFDRVAPTYLEFWPKELCSLSIAQVSIRLDLNDMLRLGCANGEWGEVFRGDFGDSVGDLSKIEAKLDEAISKFPNGAFVRLGSRSPKDSWVGCREGFKVTSGKEALRRLTDSSERVHDDLSLALANEYEAFLFVRQWMDIPPESEFRCFMKGRKLVGVSQYQYRDVFPWVKENKEGIHFAIEEFFHDFKKASHLDDVVFDVFVKLRRRGNESEYEVKLLEINPFFEMTDPCLFDWRNGGDFDGSFRTKGQEKP